MRIADRASTAEEQRRFASTAGAEFTNSLAMVNTAMATWPALRCDESAGAKADYVAVCVYLGQRNGAVVSPSADPRVARPPAMDGYPECLASGLRRLPIQRRAVLCGVEDPDPYDPRWRVGAVLTVPTFHSASATLTALVPGACADILIWSRTGRQVSVLTPNQPVDETVFLAGARFLVLAIDVRPDSSPQTPAPVPPAAPQPAAPPPASMPQASTPPGPEPPKIAILMRELLPDEDPTRIAYDEADSVALRRLSRALARRRGGPCKPIDDPLVAARVFAIGFGAA